MWSPVVYFAGSDVFVGVSNIMPVSARFIAFIAVLILSHAPVSGQKGWNVFSAPGQNFEVLVPGTMRDGQKKVLTDIGAIYPVTWMCEGKPDEPNFLFLLSYIDYPESTFSPDSISMIREMFDTSIRTHIDDLKGDLVYSSASDHGELPGAIFRATYDQRKFVVKGRLILDGDRLYFLQVYTTTYKSLNADMDRFLDSFRLRPPKDK